MRHNISFREYGKISRIIVTVSPLVQCHFTHSAMNRVTPTSTEATLVASVYIICGNSIALILMVIETSLCIWCDNILTLR